MENKNLTKLEKKILKKIKLPETKKELEKLKGNNLNKYNFYRQKYIGNKEYDYFSITEPGTSEDKIFKLNSLDDWAYKNWKFQKKHGTLVREVYDTVYISGDWFRALEIPELGRKKRELVYGMLESALSYVNIAISENLQEKIEKKYPFIYARPYGVDLFQKIPNSKLLRMTDNEKRAGGKENELSQLEEKLRFMHFEIEDIVIERIKPYSGYSFRKLEEGVVKNDNLDVFIIGGIEAAKNISFKTFFPDFYNLIQPSQILDNLIEELTDNFSELLFDETYIVSSERWDEFSERSRKRMEKLHKKEGK